jgi:NTE family protein
VASIFDGLSSAERALVVAKLGRLHFEAGSIVMVEGERPRQMYVVESGFADIFVADHSGIEHRVNRVGPGGTLGEMGLFTGEPASATVRAVDGLNVFVVDQDEFLRVATAVPRIYHNLGAILSQKLFRADRRTLNRGGEVVCLRDRGAPPVLGYALAASVAWHTRRPTLLLVLADQPPSALIPLARREDPSRDGADSAKSRRAELAIVPPAGAYAPAALPATLEQLTRRYDWILVQSTGDTASVAALATRCVDLAAAGDAQLAADSRPTDQVTLQGWVEPDRSSADGARSGIFAVPALAAADVEALSGGWLPAATPASRVLGRAARQMCHLSVALALGGGGNKGYAHVGVLRALERLGIPLDFLAGTSIGSAVAALRALDHDPEAIANVLDLFENDLFRPALSLRGLFSDAAVRARLRRIGVDRRIEDLPIPLAIIAADIAQGREVIFRKGLVWAAVFASISIPGIYPAKPMGEHMLVDGAVVDPVPVDVAAAMGADVVIGVKLRSGQGLTRVEAEAVEPDGTGSSVVEAVTRSLEILQTSISPDTERAMSILICPSFEATPGWGLRGFSRGRRYIESGELATAEAMPRLAAAMPWVAT